MGWTQTGFTEDYAKSLSADYDLAIRPSDMTFLRDLSSCHDTHLFHIIFKSHYA